MTYQVAQYSRCKTCHMLCRVVDGLITEHFYTEFKNGFTSEPIRCAGSNGEFESAELNFGTSGE